MRLPVHTTHGSSRPSTVNTTTLVLFLILESARALRSSAVGSAEWSAAVIGMATAMAQSVVPTTRRMSLARICPPCHVN